MKIACFFANRVLFSKTRSPFCVPDSLIRTHIRNMYVCTFMYKIRYVWMYCRRQATSAREFNNTRLTFCSTLFELCVGTFKHMYVRMYIRESVNMYIWYFYWHMLVNTNIFMYVYMYIRIYKYVRTYMNAERLLFGETTVALSTRVFSPHRVEHCDLVVLWLCKRQHT